MKKLILVILLSLVCSHVYAKNLYVSSSGGNDETTYENNDISHPWATVSKGFTSPLPGDTVYFRTGSYTISGNTTTIGNTNPTDESGRVTFKNYPGETVTFNTAYSPADPDTYAAIQIDRDYYTISGIILNNTGASSFIMIGKNASATAFIFEHCTADQTQYGGSGNLGILHYYGAYALNSIVRYNTFTGPGYSGNTNTAGIYLFRNRGIKIYNNEFYDWPNAIYYKHTGLGSDTGIEVYNNYGTGLMNGLQWVGQYAQIYNNILVCHGNGVSLGVDGGTGDDGANIGGGYNTFSHNTILLRDRNYGNGDEGPVYIYWGGNGDPATNNVFVDNIFDGGGNGYSYYATYFDPLLTSNYNLYEDSIYYHGASYILANWITYYSQDANSVAGTPIFTGGATPATIAGFLLTDLSPGYQVGTTGDDMGADVSLVGVNIDIYDPPTITAPAGFSTTESSVEITGSYTVDPALSVSTCTWSLGVNSGFCVAILGTFTGTVTGLEIGANSVQVSILDSNGGTSGDTVSITRLKVSKINGSATIKNATIHQ